MNLNNILARIKRNKFEETAGDYYRGNDSLIVKDLQKNGKAAILGIHHSNGMYTILGYEELYYKTKLGNIGQVSVSDFLLILQKNALELGKTANFEFIDINDNDSVWVSDGPTMNAIWNTLLLLEKK